MKTETCEKEGRKDKVVMDHQRTPWVVLTAECEHLSTCAYCVFYSCRRFGSSSEKGCTDTRRRNICLEADRRQGTAGQHQGTFFEPAGPG